MITNQASLELTSSFQEVQILKSRDCIEEDRFSRNDTQNQMLKKEKTIGVNKEEQFSSTKKITKTNEEMEIETDENQPKGEKKVSIYHNTIERKNKKVSNEISNKEKDKKAIDGNGKGAHENQPKDREKVETSDN